MGRTHPGHPSVQRCGHLGWHEVVPVPGNARVQMGIDQRHSLNQGQDQACSAPVHPRKLDPRPLARSTLILHAFPRSLPASHILANNRAEHFLPETYLRAAARAQPQPVPLSHHWPYSSTFNEVTKPKINS